MAVTYQQHHQESKLHSGIPTEKPKMCPSQYVQEDCLHNSRTIEYGAIVWDPHTKSDIDRLERVQRRAARFITNDYRSRTPGCVTNMLHDLKLPSLQIRRIKAAAAHFYVQGGGRVGPGYAS